MAQGTRRDRTGRRAAAVVAAAVAVLAGVGCTASSESTSGSRGLFGQGTSATTTPSAPADQGEAADEADADPDTSEGDAAPEATTTTAPPSVEAAPPSVGADPPGARVGLDGVESCRELAHGPWAWVPHGADPLGAVRAGRMPEFIREGPDRTPLDQVTDMPTVDDYEDPSTLEDPATVRQAFVDAGYQDGVDARYEDGNYLTAITMVRFRDAAGASAALSAHLADYCSRAEDGYVRTERNGMVVLRDSGTARTMYVLDDVAVSVLVCVCYVDDPTERQHSVERWSEELDAALGEGPPATDSPV
ncbi:MAG TPA: hypothetical protein VHK88_16095 [Aquihabitans sp.]|jgi:hypothetical protein|nr:hypothetical protein [Aquihabitans sp.]